MANNVNARFKVWINGGWVTITLMPGRELNWHRGGRTDEGWDITEHSWLLEGGTIHRSIVSDGTDCDGRLTHWYMSMARIEDIDKDRQPDWISCETSTRDHQAEAAGY